MISLSRLLHRLQYAIPEEYHNEIEREISKFETEISRMSMDDDKIGQATLTKSEIRRLPMGNQHTHWNTIRWQAVKGAAIHYDVTDWIAEVDPTLTYEENIDIMRREGNSMTMGEMEQYR